MATTKPTFQNQTNGILAAPRYNFSCVEVPRNKYIVGSYYLENDTLNGVSTGIPIFQVMGFTNVSSGTDPAPADIVYDYDTAESENSGNSGSNVQQGVTNLTDNVSTPFATFPILDGENFTGEIQYEVLSVKGTAQQSLASRVRFSATREGGVYTVSISEVGVQTLAATAGTLTGAISIAGAASLCTLSANFNTSFVSPDSFTISSKIYPQDDALVITFIA